MEFSRYEKLRAKFQNKDFEEKNKGKKKFLWIISWVGNIASIFFAYFLLYPALYKTIGAHSETNATIGAGVITVLILALFEYLKRMLIKPLAFNLIKNKYKISAGIVGEFIITLLVIGISFYFSLSGARNFAITSKTINTTIVNNNLAVIDSITKVAENDKNTYVIDNTKLRDNNSTIREKLINTDVRQTRIRKDYQEIIDKNTQQISENDNKIKEIGSNLVLKISEIKKEGETKVNNNKNEDITNICLFVLLSTTIEFLIILGIWYHENYDIKVYYLNNNKMEKTFVKRDRYQLILKYIYKNGELKVGEKITAVSTLKELIKEKTRIPNPNKFVEEFVRDMDSFKIFIIQGKRRFINLSYEEALKIVDKADDTINILDNIE